MKRSRLAGELRNAGPLLIVALAAIVLQAAGNTEFLIWQRGSLTAEPWRLFSAHLVHVGWAHLGLNLAGLVLVWALFGRSFRAGGWVGVMAVSAAAIGLGLEGYSPQVGWYVGFSGVLHGMLVAGAVASLRAFPGVAAALLLLIAVKVGLEQLGTGTDGVEQLIGAPVIVDAHLYGALAGLVCGLVAWLPFRASRSRST